MGFFSWGKKEDSKKLSDQLEECVKCHKKKGLTEGKHIWGGKAYCCSSCCGDPKKGEPEKQAANTCEFC